MRGTISCKSGNTFMITCEPFTIDFLQDVEYYLDQGCKVEIVNDRDANFTKCDCDHCKTLKH